MYVITLVVGCGGEVCGHPGLGMCDVSRECIFIAGESLVTMDRMDILWVALSCGPSPPSPDLSRLCSAPGWPLVTTHHTSVADTSLAAHRIKHLHADGMSSLELEN